MFFYSSLGAVRLRHGWSSKQDERRKQVVAARRVVLVRVGESFSGLLSPAGPPARHGGSNPVHALFTWPPHRAGPISPQPQALLPAASLSLSSIYSSLSLVVWPSFASPPLASLSSFFLNIINPQLCIIFSFFVNSLWLHI